MARTRKKKATEVEQLTEAPAATEAPTEAPTQSPTDPSPEVTPSEVTQPAKQHQPDPFKLDSIALGSEKDSPRMHLWRSNKFQQMAVTFDERPEEKYLDQLREAGFSYRGAEKAWTRQFMEKSEYNQMDEQERAARRSLRHYEARKLFVDIANGIREDMGLQPVITVGM